MSFPDLNNLSESDLVTFIDSTELSNPQRQQVLKASDKNDMYSKILRLRTINVAGAAIYDGRQLLRTNGIFIPASVVKMFKDAFNKLSEAHSSQRTVLNCPHAHRSLSRPSDDAPQHAPERRAIAFGDFGRVSTMRRQFLRSTRARSALRS
jgi:hypothetical protein